MKGRASGCRQSIVRARPSTFPSPVSPVASSSSINHEILQQSPTGPKYASPHPHRPLGLARQPRPRQRHHRLPLQQSQRRAKPRDRASHQRLLRLDLGFGTVVFSQCPLQLTLHTSLSSPCTPVPTPFHSCLLLIHPSTHPRAPTRSRSLTTRNATDCPQLQSQARLLQQERPHPSQHQWRLLRQDIVGAAQVLHFAILPHLRGVRQGRQGRQWGVGLRSGRMSEVHHFGCVSVPN